MISLVMPVFKVLQVRAVVQVKQALGLVSFFEIFSAAVILVTFLVPAAAVVDMGINNVVVIYAMIWNCPLKTLSLVNKPILMFRH